MVIILESAKSIYKIIYPLFNSLQSECIFPSSTPVEMRLGNVQPDKTYRWYLIQSTFKYSDNWVAVALQNKGMA